MMATRNTRRLVWPVLGGSIVMLMIFSSIANAATAAELLEKGIYAEETVGDLDAAIKVYQQVIAEGKKSNRAAAEAQFRIGMCLKKQGKSAEATEAFEKVVEQFPTETELVTKAKSQLPGSIALLPVPWGDGDQLQLEMKLATGLGVGTQIYRVSRNNSDGSNRWQCDTWQTITINGQHSRSRVLVDGETFAPITSTWRHTLLGQATADYKDDSVTIRMNSKDNGKTIDFDPPVFDNEQAAEAFRRLPLIPGYKTTMNIVATLSSTEIPLGLEVTGIETIDVPAGKFECFRLELNIGQTFWISNDAHRYIVRFDAGGVSAELNKITSQLANKPVLVDEERFRLTLPTDWFAYTPSGTNDASPSTTLIDSANQIDARVEVGPLDSVKKEHATSAEWLSSSIEKYRERLKDFQITGDGVRPMTIDGHDAVVAEFTYVKDDKTMKAKRIAFFGDSTAVNLRFTSEADQFADLEPSIDAIVDSFELK